jgi:hypothetical protein
MKITVVRSGGILGTPRRWEVTLDDRDDRESWLMLVRELPWNETPRVPPAPDRYVYRISCARRKVVLPEQALVGGWRELVDRVRDAAGQQ